MLITLCAIVLRERDAAGKGRFIDVLSQQLGVIEIYVRNNCKINSKSSCATQLFAYSKLCINQSKGKFYLNSAEPVNIFYGLRTDLDKLSLAAYLSEIVLFAVGNDSNSTHILKLLLNTFHFLACGSRPPALLKSIFEMRFMSEIGFMPNVVACSKCSRHIADSFFFLVRDSYIICSDCCKIPPDNSVKLPQSALEALRFIILSDFKRLFNFKVSDKIQVILSKITEDYLIFHLDCNFKTLDFLKSLSVM